MTRYATTPPPVDLWVGPYTAPYAVSNATVWPVANRALLQSFRVNRPVTVSTAYFRVVTQSGNMDVGIYDAAGNRLASTGSFAVPAAAVTCSRALTAPVTLVPGRKYFAALACDNGVAVFTCYTTQALPAVPGYIRQLMPVTSMPLPATTPVAVEGTQTIIPAVFFA